MHPFLLEVPVRTLAMTQILCQSVPFSATIPPATSTKQIWKKPTFPDDLSTKHPILADLGSLKTGGNECILHQINQFVGVPESKLKANLITSIKLQL